MQPALDQADGFSATPTTPRQRGGGDGGWAGGGVEPGPRAPKLAWVEAAPMEPDGEWDLPLDCRQARVCGPPRTRVAAPALPGAMSASVRVRCDALPGPPPLQAEPLPAVPDDDSAGPPAGKAAKARVGWQRPTHTHTHSRRTPQLGWMRQWRSSPD